MLAHNQPLYAVTGFLLIAGYILAVIPKMV